ncbi:MAG: hypothetical protein H0W44_00575 [Gammaproteobacteria bacterium]|nr:hypothetical protein [Gammaproteobacteria bacterium]
MIKKIDKLAGQTFPQSVSILFATIVTVLGMFLWQSHNGQALLWDEGFLWYGVQRVMVGEVPIRDFMAYDPGRYYWSATLMGLWGDNGLVALRATTSIFQAICLFIGLKTIFQKEVQPNLILLGAVTITLALWTFLNYRFFDTCLPYLLIGVLTFLINKPSYYRYFITGLIVGLAAVFGRNHGVYGVLATLGVMGYLAIRDGTKINFIKAFFCWGGGIFIGYLPVLLMLITMSGFASAFIDSIVFLFESQATNIFVPIPWPWRVPFGQLPLFEILQGLLLGFSFIAIGLFWILGIPWVLWRKWKEKQVAPALVASVFLALPYSHYAYSRADLHHLAPGIPPLLIGILVLSLNQSIRIKAAIVGLLFVTSLIILVPGQPSWICLKHTCNKINIGADQFKVVPSEAADLMMLKKLTEEFTPNGESFVAMPFWPGAYAVLNRKSPVWETYVLFPRSEAFQKAEIERIKASDVKLVIIFDYPLDGRDELRFRNTHLILDEYFINNFKRYYDDRWSPIYRIYIKK